MCFDLRAQQAVFELIDMSNTHEVQPEWLSFTNQFPHGRVRPLAFCPVSRRGDFLQEPSHYSTNSVLAYEHEVVGNGRKLALHNLDDRNRRRLFVGQAEAVKMANRL